MTICKLVLQSDYQKMTQIEIASLLFKSIVMWAAVYFDLFSRYGVLIFGISQLIYSLVLLVFGFIIDPGSLKLSELPKAG